jgi:outer membrane immunogenic protein
MKRMIRTTSAVMAALVSCGWSAAFAGDAVDWSRPYAGLSAGGVATAAELSGGGAGDVTQEGDGGTVGVYAGMTLHEFGQADGRGWMLGAEASLATLAGDDQTRDAALGGAVTLEGGWIADATLQLGYGCDRTRLFGEVGLALTDLTVSGAGASSDALRVGVTLGAGIDHAIADSWTARLAGSVATFGEEEVRHAGGRRDLGIGVARVELGLARRF